MQKDELEEETSARADEGNSDRGAFNFGYKVVVVLIVVAFLVTQIMKVLDGGSSITVEGDSVQEGISQSLQEFEEEFESSETKEKWGVFKDVMGNDW